MLILIWFFHESPFLKKIFCFVMFTHSHLILILFTLPPPLCPAGEEAWGKEVPPGPPWSSRPHRRQGRGTCSSGPARSHRGQPPSWSTCHPLCQVWHRPIETFLIFIPCIWNWKNIFFVFWIGKRFSSYFELEKDSHGCISSQDHNTWVTAYSPAMCKHVKGCVL